MWTVGRRPARQFGLKHSPNFPRNASRAGASPVLDRNAKPQGSANRPWASTLRRRVATLDAGACQATVGSKAMTPCPSFNKKLLGRIIPQGYAAQTIATALEPMCDKCLALIIPMCRISPTTSVHDTLGVALLCVTRQPSQRSRPLAGGTDGRMQSAEALQRRRQVVLRPSISPILLCDKVLRAARWQCRRWPWGSDRKSHARR